MIKTSKQKPLTIEEFNKCSFYFEQGRPTECVQHNSFESSIMSSQVVYCSIMLYITKIEKDFVIAVFLYKQIFSCSVILAFTKTITCFEVVMFHVLTSCVSFDYVVNCDNNRDFAIRDFIVTTNCVLLTHHNNHETSTDCHKFFVLISYNQS